MTKYVDFSHLFPEFFHLCFNRYFFVLKLQILQLFFVENLHTEMTLWTVPPSGLS